MKQVTTILCCLGMMGFGAFIACPSIENAFSTYKTISAAPTTVAQVVGKPLEVRFGSNERLKTDTITICDTIRDTVKVTNTKYVKVREPKRTTVMYKPMPIPGPMACVPVNNKFSKDREEKTLLDSIGSKPNEITLTVDGQVVYSRKNDNYSAEKSQ